MVHLGGSDILLDIDVRSIPADPLVPMGSSGTPGPGADSLENFKKIRGNMSVINMAIIRPKIA